MSTNPYDAQMEECIAHIQKCMGLLDLNPLPAHPAISTGKVHLADVARGFKAQKKRKKKLSDRKNLSARNRLTDVLISKTQRYYSMAIRNNINDLHSMKTAVWAVDFQLQTRALNINSSYTFKEAEAEFNERHYDHKHMHTCIYTIMN
ncbi:hypothetical protein TNCV_3331951 [Trichonephila clavipes]|nr:hypothetical protein TNCV_3331951 [Trichonephila clavipes]